MRAKKRRPQVRRTRQELQRVVGAIEYEHVLQARLADVTHHHAEEIRALRDQLAEAERTIRGLRSELSLLMPRRLA